MSSMANCVISSRARSNALRGDREPGQMDMNRETHKPTQALAAFAAGLDPASLPADVREKLGWLLLDFLRVASLGARLPWSDWARRYVGVVGRAGSSHVLFSSQMLNPQHATFLNVT